MCQNCQNYGSGGTAPHSHLPHHRLLRTFSFTVPCDNMEDFPYSYRENFSQFFQGSADPLGIYHSISDLEVFWRINLFNFIDHCKKAQN
eukprot:SAG22_NODE_568_length_9030_cov_2.503527_4_plen_89_part_00